MRSGNLIMTFPDSHRSTVKTGMIKKYHLSTFFSQSLSQNANKMTHFVHNNQPEQFDTYVSLNFDGVVKCCPH